MYVNKCDYNNNKISKRTNQQSMHKFSLIPQASPQCLHLKYLQSTHKDSTVLILQLSNISQTNTTPSQTGLALDFSIRDTAEKEKVWGGFEYRLKELFQTVVVGSMLPGCQLRVSVFVLMGEVEVEAAIINALFAGLVIMGIPMQYSIYALNNTPINTPTNTTNNNNTIIVDSTSTSQLKQIYGKYSGENRYSADELKQQMEEFNNTIIGVINRMIQV